MTALTIANNAIRQDAEGRYCLNDLHRAAGAEAKHQPANWLRSQQTQELIVELAGSSETRNEGNQALRVYQGGSGPQGTYVAKELVYAYAMWISPAFHLKVIRAYDAMVSKPAGLNAGNLTRMELLRLAMQAEEEREALQHQVDVLAPKADALDRISASDEAVTVTEAAKVLGIKREKLTNWLHANGWVYRQNGRWVAYQQHIENGRLQYKEATYTDQKTGQECHAPYCHILPKGMAKLATVFSVKEEV